jgi:hypothetical protein
MLAIVCVAALQYVLRLPALPGPLEWSSKHPVLPWAWLLDLRFERSYGVHGTQLFWVGGGTSGILRPLLLPPRCRTWLQAALVAIRAAASSVQWLTRCESNAALLSELSALISKFAAFFPNSQQRHI